MKVMYSLLILVALQTHGQASFDKTFGGSGFDRGMYIAHTSDKGYILCGYSNSSSKSYDHYIIKLNRNHETEWQKSYGGPFTDIAWQVLELKDKGFLLMGSKGIDSTNDDIYLLRFDAKGNTVWEKTFGNEKYERTTCIFPTSDGHFLLIGQRNVEGLTNIDSYVLKIDEHGNLLWEKTFGGPKVERTFYGTEDADGNYLISGSVFPYNNSKADILTLKIDRNGTLLWQKTWGEENTHDIMHSFSSNKKTGGFTITGYIESAKQGVHDGLFLQMDENGNIIDTKKHHTGNDLRLMHSKETKDGGFIATGFTRSDITQNLWDAVLLKFDRSGNVKWMKTYGSPDKDDQGYWVVVNDDGGYTFTGYTLSKGPGGDLWLVRTNARGEVQ